MKRSSLIFLATAALLLSFNSLAGTVIINFDTDAYDNPLTAPPYIDVNAPPLTDLYAPLGVHFSGPANGVGGRIANDAGHFLILALSGQNFLAFSGLPIVGASPPETIAFDTPMSSVSIYVTSGPSYEGTFTMQGFGGRGVEVDSDTLTTSFGQYSELSVSSPTGIQSVVLSCLNYPYNLPGWYYDDLTATPVPEASALPLALFGLTFSVFLRRRRTRGCRQLPMARPVPLRGRRRCSAVPDPGR